MANKILIVVFNIVQHLFQEQQPLSFYLWTYSICLLYCMYFIFENEGVIIRFKLTIIKLITIFLNQLCVSKVSIATISTSFRFCNICTRTVKSLSMVNYCPSLLWIFTEGILRFYFVYERSLMGHESFCENIMAEIVHIQE